MNTRLDDPTTTADAGPEGHVVLKEVAMSSSQAGGLEGHQWRLHRSSGTRLPCRVLCECGWTSTAGPEASVLLELKGHLEDSLLARDTDPWR
jgi:hypothetical protein